jgi:hypothetical protein
MVRRIVTARVADQATVDDLVQETLARVLAAARIEPGMLEPYATVTARNVVCSSWREEDRHRRNRHRAVDLRPPEVPGDELVPREEHSAVASTLASGVRVVARDTGPVIPDVPRAMADGYSTCRGLGLGLPGARRLVDEFAVASEVGRGTTVTMTTWRGEG